MTLNVAVTTTAVIILLPIDLERLGARLTAAVLISLNVGWESRTGGASWPRSLAYGLLALAMKWFIRYCAAFV